MKVICVDDEEMMLGLMKMRLEHIGEIDEIHTFDNPMDALDFLGTNKVDVVFQDIQMPQMDGITLARHIKEVQPECSIVFVTGYSEYKTMALGEKCSGYLLKPASEQEIEMALTYIKSKNKPKVTSRMRVQCFGNFEVFIDDQPVKFKRSKTKEVLAYLVDRKGARVSAAEICAVVWYDAEDEDKAQQYFRACISDLRSVLKENKLEEVLVAERNAYGVNTNEFWCDSYEFAKGNIDVINSYNKEYMLQYSWSEDRMGEFGI